MDLTKEELLDLIYDVRSSQTELYNVEVKSAAGDSQKLPNQWPFLSHWFFTRGNLEKRPNQWLQEHYTTAAAQSPSSRCNRPPLQVAQSAAATLNPWQLPHWISCGRVPRAHCLSPGSVLHHVGSLSLPKRASRVLFGVGGHRQRGKDGSGNAVIATPAVGDCLLTGPVQVGLPPGPIPVTLTNIPFD